MNNLAMLPCTPVSIAAHVCGRVAGAATTSAALTTSAAIAIAIAIGLALSFAPAPAAAQAAAAQAAAAAQPADDTLYRDLGGEACIRRLVDDFTDRLMADRRMEPFFHDTDLKTFKSQLAAQLCEVSGGPCKRKGKDMKTVHSAQDVSRGDFNTIVEVLQDSMDAEGIAFATQNRLLARLAPMHRDIVNVH